LETMQIKTAAPLYDIDPRALQTLCTRGVVKSVKVNGRHYVTPAEMDRVFKSINPAKEGLGGKGKK